MPIDAPTWEETTAAPRWEDTNPEPLLPDTPSLRVSALPPGTSTGVLRQTSQPDPGVTESEAKVRRVQMAPTPTQAQLVEAREGTGPTVSEAFQELGQVALHGPQGILPRLGEPGTALRGVTDAIASLAETGLSAEGIAIMAGLSVPVVGETLALMMAGMGVKQAAQDLGEASVTGNRETAARGATIGALSALPAAHVFKSARQQQAPVRLSAELESVLNSPEIIRRLEAAAERRIAELRPIEQRVGSRLPADQTLPPAWEETTPAPADPVTLRGAPAELPKGATIAPQAAPRPELERIVAIEAAKLKPAAEDLTSPAGPGDKPAPTHGAAVENVKPWHSDSALAEELRSIALYGTGRADPYVPKEGKWLDDYIIAEGTNEPPSIRKVRDTGLGDVSRQSNSIYPIVELGLSNGKKALVQIRISDHDQVSRSAPAEYVHDIRYSGKTHHGRNFTRQLQDLIRAELEDAVHERWRDQRDLLEKASAAREGGAAGTKTKLGEADKSGMPDWQAGSGSSLTAPKVSEVVENVKSEPGQLQLTHAAKALSDRPASIQPTGSEWWKVIYNHANGTKGMVQLVHGLKSDALKAFAENPDARSLVAVERMPNRPPAETGIISNTPAEAWADRTIQQARGNVSSGLDPELFAAHVVKGVALMERGVRKFADWAAAMIRQHGDAVRPHLRELYQESQKAMAKVQQDDGALKQRKLARRMQTAPEVPAELQERARIAPETFYRPQSTPKVEERVAAMSEAELAGVPMIQPDGPNNIWVASQMELYKRAVAQGAQDAGWAIMENAMKQGTSLGQLINQFKLLAGATPDGVLIALDRRLVKAGFDPLRPDERVRIRALADRSIQANAKWHATEREYLTAPSDENFQRVLSDRMAAIETDAELQSVIHRYNPKSFWDMLRTILQGNLLAPISLAANFVGNVNNLGWRGLARDYAAVHDAIDAHLRHRERVATVAPVEAGRQALKEVVRSLPQAVQVLSRGATDFELASNDYRGQMQPLVALRDLFSAGETLPKRGGKVPLSQRALLAVEASPFAMSATAGLRMLGAIDLPSRNSARARIVTEAMKLRQINARAAYRELSARADLTPDELARRDLARVESSLTTKQIEQAVRYPELFFRPEELLRIRKETLTAVYQQENAFASAAHRFLQNSHGMARFIASTIAPYITTPANIISELFSYTPPVSIANTLRHAAKGDRRSARVAAGKMIVGGMLTAAGTWLVSKDLIGPSLNDPAESQKGRLLSADVLPPNHLNISGLERALRGEDSRWREGDRTMDLSRGGGIAGALLLMVANVDRRLARQPEQPDAIATAGEVLKDSSLLTLGYAVNQSYLRGTAELLDALKSGDPDKWFKAYAETLTSLVLPNTLTALSRASREYKPELRGDTTLTTLNNVLKNRLGFAGATKDLPLKRDVWGRPIRETPDGANPWAYQFLDITKTRRIPNDPLALEIYTLWRRTGNNAIIPTPPDQSVQVANRTFQLTREQQSRLQELTGQARRTMGEALMANVNFINATDEAKVVVLYELWRRSAAIAKLRFLVERGGELKLKAQPAGLRR